MNDYFNPLSHLMTAMAPEASSATTPALEPAVLPSATPVMPILPDVGQAPEPPPGPSFLQEDAIPAVAEEQPGYAVAVTEPEADAPADAYAEEVTLAPSAQVAAPAPRVAMAPGALDYKQMVVEHGQWLASEGKEGKRANFRGFDLTGVDLSGQNLLEASFRSAILAGANLSGADFRNADLSEAVLDDANLSGALLTGASLARAQLHRANLAAADLVTANLTAVIAEGINLSNARLNGVILRDANLRHAELGHANLRDANLRGASIVEASLIAADLSAADCRDVNFDRGVFPGAILDGTNLRGAKLGGVDVQSADFSKTLDLSTEIQAQSMQSERIKLQEEQAQLASWRTAIESRERILAEERGQMEGQMEAFNAAHTEVAQKLGKFTRGFVLRFVFWLLVAVAIALFTLDRAEELGIETVIPAVVIMFLLLIVAFISMLRSFQVYRTLKKHIKNSLQPIVIEPSVSNPSMGASPQLPEPDINHTAPSLSQGKSKGFGFGKKKK